MGRSGGQFFFDVLFKDFRSDPVHFHVAQGAAYLIGNIFIVFIGGGLPAWRLDADIHPLVEESTQGGDVFFRFYFDNAFGGLVFDILFNPFRFSGGRGAGGNPFLFPFIPFFIVQDDIPDFTFFL